MGQPLAECDFNLAALHPAYPIKCRTSTQRTQAPESVDTGRGSGLDPLENTIRKERSFADGLANAPNRPGAGLQDRLCEGAESVRKRSSVKHEVPEADFEGRIFSMARISRATGP